VGLALAFMAMPLALKPSLGPGLLPLVLAPAAVGIYLAALVALRIVPLQPTVSILRRRLRRRFVPIESENAQPWDLEASPSAGQRAAADETCGSGVTRP
jgi:hypothetical protein